jgi:hypothetical protein
LPGVDPHDRDAVARLVDTYVIPALEAAPS